MGSSMSSPATEIAETNTALKKNLKKIKQLKQQAKSQQGGLKRSSRKSQKQIKRRSAGRR